jgi:DnaJ-domain-containing protein 1
MSAEQRRVLVAVIVCTLMAPLAVLARGRAPQVDLPDSDVPVPTAIERALIERTCRATELSTEIDAHRQCLNAQMLWLRADFGRDLGRLAGPDRRRIDAACSRLSAAGQREAYLDCLGNQLITLHNRRNRGNPTVTQEAAAAVAPSAALAPSAAPLPPARTVSSWTSIIAIAGTLGTGLAAAGFVFLTRRSRRTPHQCRTCGVDVPDSDLCPACRHEAAETLRRANAERAQSQRAQEEEERRQHDQEVEQQEQRARDEQEARMREQEMARQLAADEELHRQGDIAAVSLVAGVEKAAPAVDEPEVFDPYVVLGVPPDAGLDDIRAAYEQAKTKYDPDLVSHLGDEARAHYKTKAESVERAYQMLSDVRR